MQLINTITPVLKESDRNHCLTFSNNCLIDFICLFCYNVLDLRYLHIASGITPHRDIYICDAKITIKSNITK